MEKKDLYRFKKRLLLERKKMDEGYDHGRLGFEESLTGSTQELSAYDNHPADLGTETFERGKTWIARCQRLLRGKIDEALAIDRGTMQLHDLRAGNLGERRRFLMRLIALIARTVGKRGKQEK